MKIFLQEDGQNQRDDKFLVTEAQFLNFLERLFDLKWPQETEQK